MRGDGEDQIARDVEGEVDRALGRTAPQDEPGQDSAALQLALICLGGVLCGHEQQARAVLMQMAPAERTELRGALVTLLALEREVQMGMAGEETTDGR